jgi:chromate transporter
MSADSRASLKQLIALFLRLGFTAFGGPAAHIAMMQDEVVRRRKWLSDAEFLDLLGAASLIPGPTSTEMAIYIGRRQAGWAGILAAGTCFILPAALIVGVIAWAYVRFGSMPQVVGLLYGVKPVVIAVVLQALLGLRRVAVKTPFIMVMGVIALAAGFLGVNVAAVLLGTGVIVALASWLPRNLRSVKPPALLFGVLPPLLRYFSAEAHPIRLTSIFLVFLKIGAVLFGSGYVLLAFLRADLVQRYGWLTESHILDAIAVGQITPGPVFTTATFIGYILAGPAGAGVATLGIFLPSFVYVAASAPLIPHIRRSPLAGAFLDGVNVSALALMAMITWQLGRAAIIDIATAAIAIVSAVLLLALRINSTWLILGGGLVGLLLRLFTH